MKRKVKFQEGGQVETPPPPARRPSLITNEPVGARLGRALRSMFGSGEQRSTGPRINPRGQSTRTAPAPARREASPQELDRMRAALPAGPDIPTEMRNAMPARPDAAAERRAARPAQAPRPRVREMSADELNEMELRRIRAERQMEEDDARERMRRREERVAAPVDVGAASARARGEQVGPPGDYNMKKGGIVKKKAGGMIAAKPKAAPKKMMKGGMVTKPKVAAKSKAKPMPFKKGGVIKKGKK